MYIVNKINRFRPSLATVYNCCMLWRGPWRFVHPRGGNGTRGEAEGAIYPRECTKPMDPSHSVQQLFCYTFVKLLFLFSKFCCHLQTLLRQTIHCLQETMISNPQLFRTQGWKSTNAGNEPGDVTVYITFHVTQPVEPCNMRVTWFVLDQSLNPTWNIETW